MRFCRVLELDTFSIMSCLDKSIWRTSSSAGNLSWTFLLLQDSGKNFWWVCFPFKPPLMLMVRGLLNKVICFFLNFHRILNVWNISRRYLVGRILLSPLFIFLPNWMLIYRQKQEEQWNLILYVFSVNYVMVKMPTM